MDEVHLLGNGLHLPGGREHERGEQPAADLRYRLGHSARLALLHAMQRNIRSHSNDFQTQLQALRQGSLRQLQQVVEKTVPNRSEEAQGLRRVRRTDGEPLA